MLWSNAAYSDFSLLLWSNLIMGLWVRMTKGTIFLKSKSRNKIYFVIHLMKDIAYAPKWDIFSLYRTLNKQTNIYGLTYHLVGQQTFYEFVARTRTWSLYCRFRVYVKRCACLFVREHFIHFHLFLFNLLYTDNNPYTRV